MNRFFRNFIVLPLIFFVFFFHAGAIGACSCGSVLPGQKITVTILDQKNNNKEWEPKTTAGETSERNAKAVITKLMVRLGQFYFFEVNDKNNGLIEAVAIWREKQKSINIKESQENVKLADSFIKAFLSSQNNHFYHLQFQSQEIIKVNNDSEVPTELHFSENEKNEKIIDLTIQVYFQEDKNTKNPKKWSFLLKVDKAKITRSDQGVLKDFDFQESNLEIDDLQNEN